MVYTKKKTFLGLFYNGWFLLGGWWYSQNSYNPSQDLWEAMLMVKENHIAKKILLLLHKNKFYILFLFFFTDLLMDTVLVSALKLEFPPVVSMLAAPSGLRVCWPPSGCWRATTTPPPNTARVPRIFSTSSCQLKSTVMPTQLFGSLFQITFEDLFKVFRDDLYRFILNMLK